MSVTLPSAEQALPPVHHYHDGVLVALDVLEGRRYRLMPPSCPTNVSRRTGRASGPLPQLASSAVPEAEAPLPADPHASPSGEQACHPEIRVRRDAPVVRPCRFVERSPFWSFLFSSQRDGTTHISPPRKGELRSRKNADRRCGILRCGKPTCTGVEIAGRKLVTDRCRA